jgi:lipid II:glycine glycyltransferase (peptidoglycan interpeptide bridge formation enzyme)
MAGIELTKIKVEDLPFQDVFLQTPFWAKAKRSKTWTPLAFLIKAGEIEVPLLVLLRLIRGAGLMAYVPHGPLLAPQEAAQRTLFLQDLSKTLKSFLPRQTFAIRYDLPWGVTSTLEQDREDGAQAPEPLDKPLRKGTTDIQVPDTVILDLKKDEETLLAEMKKKTRYNIRLAEKKGVSIKEEGEESLSAWYKVYQETAKRDKIAIHPYSYYVNVFRSASSFTENVKISVFNAYLEEEYLGGIIVLVCGQKATYLYGASSNQHRNLMANYLLQWKAILWAQQSGASSYDFFGIPPEEEEGHAMEGLYRFKTGFGGEIHHRLGCWDYPMKGLSYGVFRLGEGLRNWYYKTFKKR